MGFLDNLKGGNYQAAKPAQADGLPEVAAAPRSDGATQIKAQLRNFFTQKRTVGASEMPEDSGLPVMNRRSGSNKLVTILGFVLILFGAAALLLSLNTGDKRPAPKKHAQEERLASSLPALVMPVLPTPKPLAVSAPGPQVPALKAGKADAQPILLQTPNAQTALLPNGKPPLDWTDRKMGGNLLVKEEGGGAPAASGGNATGAATDAMVPTTSSAQRLTSLFPQAPGGAGAAGGSQNDFASKLEPTMLNAVSASLLPDRNFLITRGSTLDCALETALDSTVPGMTTCRLTRDVYSDNGKVLLLDRGSQLVGEYQGGIKQGQVRLFVLWTRAKTPNGVIVSLNSPGTDALGRSGHDGWVDNRFMERFGAAILMSFIQDSVAALINKNGSGSGTTVYGNTVNSGEKVVEKILESTVNIPPTMVKNQGDHIQVMVARDLDFSGVYSLRVKK